MHWKVWNWISRNREALIFAALITIAVELFLDMFVAGAVTGIVALVLQSHVLCCIIPLMVFKRFHKDDCHCHVHEHVEDAEVGC